MNRCKNILIKCPYALKMWEEFPCIGTELKCEEWIKKYKEHNSEEYAIARKIIFKHKELSHEEKVKILEKELSELND